MKVLVFSTQILPTPPPYYGGAELVAFTDALWLARRGHDVTLVATKHSKASAFYLMGFEPPFKVVEYGEPGTVDNKKLEEEAWESLEDKDYDIIIDHSWNKPTYKSKLPVLGVVHGLNPQPPFWRPRDKPCLLGVSKFHAVYLANHWLVNVAHLPNHIVVEPYLKYSVVDEKEDMLVFLGRVDPGKGIMYFIQLCAQLPKYKCVIIGDDSLLVNHDYVRKVYEVAMRLPNVDWLGMQPFDAKVDYIRRARAVFVYPVPPYAEVFGLWALEAFLMGTPVITSPYGAMPEYVVSGYNGFIIHPEDFYQLPKLVEKLPTLKLATPSELRLYALRNFGEETIAPELERLMNYCKNEGW
jgi:glycosyltransferase involved in cell wall biosynthesis